MKAKCEEHLSLLGSFEALSSEQGDLRETLSGLESLLRRKEEKEAKMNAELLETDERHGQEMKEAGEGIARLEGKVRHLESELALAHEDLESNLALLAEGEGQVRGLKSELELLAAPRGKRRSVT